MGEWKRGGQAVADQEEAQTPSRAVEQREGHGEGRMRAEGALGSCAGGGKGKGMWGAGEAAGKLAQDQATSSRHATQL